MSDLSTQTVSSETAISTLPQTAPHRRFLPVDRSRRSVLRWPLGLIGMLILTASIESYLSRFPLRLLDPPTYSWAYSADRAVHQASKAEILVLGDSLMKHGMVPSILTKESERTSDSAAAASAPAAWTYFAFKRALDAGAKPKAIVFDLKPSVMTGSPYPDLRRFQQTLTWSESLDLISVSKNLPIAVSLLLGKLVPSAVSRVELRMEMASALANGSSRHFFLNQICRRNWDVNGGANLARKHPEFDGKVDEPTHRKLASNYFKPNKINRTYAERIVRLAKDRGIKCYLVIPPFSPAIQERRKDSGAMAKYAAFVRTLQEIDIGLTVFDASDADYPADVFVDAGHLDRDGAITLSVDIGRFLKYDDSGSDGHQRWITLPKFHAVPSDPFLEDIERSRQVLGIDAEALTPK